MYDCLFDLSKLTMYIMHKKEKNTCSEYDISVTICIQVHVTKPKI